MRRQWLFVPLGLLIGVGMFVTLQQQPASGDLQVSGARDDGSPGPALLKNLALPQNIESLYQQLADANSKISQLTNRAEAVEREAQLLQPASTASGADHAATPSGLPTGGDTFEDAQNLIATSADFAVTNNDDVTATRESGFDESKDDGKKAEPAVVVEVNDPVDESGSDDSAEIDDPADGATSMEPSVVDAELDIELQQVERPSCFRQHQDPRRSNVSITSSLSSEFAPLGPHAPEEAQLAAAATNWGVYHDRAAFTAKVRARHPINIITLGGSVTCGCHITSQPCQPNKAWPNVLSHMLQRCFGTEVVVRNLCQPAVTSGATAAARASS